jgi:hypothetical protein
MKIEPFPASLAMVFNRNMEATMTYQGENQALSNNTYH